MIIVNDMKQEATKAGKEVITTGFGCLDALIGGWHNGELVLIGGRPAMGKTSFITSSLINLSVVNKMPAAVFSLEQYSSQIMNCIRCGLCEGMGKEEYLWDGMISQAPIIIHDCARESIERVRRHSKVLKEAYGIRLIYIDYLQLLDCDEKKFESIEKEVVHIVNELKAMATELDITVICCCQLTRSTEEWSPNSQLTRSTEKLRPNIEHFGFLSLACADTVIAIHRPDYYRIYEDERGNDLRGIAELLVLKSKYGKGGYGRLKFNTSAHLLYEHVREETKEYAVFRKIENRNL